MTPTPIIDAVVVVPARGGSKRLPGKNLRELGGHTLLGWTARAIAEAGLDLPVLLTTDSPEIAEAGRAVGWHVPFLRPAELATDNSPTLDAVLHLLDWRLAQGLAEAGALILLQPTSPFRGGACLREGLDLLTSDTDTDAVVGMRRLPHDSGTLYRPGAGLKPSPVDGDHPRTDVLMPNGALYVIRPKTLRRERSFFPACTRALVMNDMQSIDIDTPHDWRTAEAALAAET